MIKYRFIFTPVILLLLGIMIWRAPMLFTNGAAMFSNVETSSDSELSTKTTRHEVTITVNESSHDIDNSNSGSYETIEGTIARINRDVIVTGTITGTPGQESAIFQIEGMPDLSFQINTQLMDGFIITDITENQIVLKNQIGDESFSLNVR